jgi:chemotaxis protein methyltransferase CheR
MKDSEFEFIRTLVYERSRISLDDRKRELVTARLGKRMRAKGVDSVSDYCRLLHAPEQEEERVRLIDAISTNHTFFFRERAHFDLVRDHIIPEMAGRASAEGWTRFDAWSAACSSGEEAYSLAMTLASRLDGGRWPWQIEGTDISHRVLETATRAIYKEDAVISHTPDWAMAGFERGFGPQLGNYRVKAALRARVHFRQLNLLEATPPFTAPLQLIFCRNVMIYFDRRTQEELIARLTSHLVPGGYLIVGHSEGLSGVSHQLEPVQPSVYRLPAAR